MGIFKALFKRKSKKPKKPKVDAARVKAFNAQQKRRYQIVKILSDRGYTSHDARFDISKRKGFSLYDASEKDLEAARKVPKFKGLSKVAQLAAAVGSANQNHAPAAWLNAFAKGLGVSKKAAAHYAFYILYMTFQKPEYAKKAKIPKGYPRFNEDTQNEYTLWIEEEVSMKGLLKVLNKAIA